MQKKNCLNDIRMWTYRFMRVMSPKKLEKSVSSVQKGL